MHNFEQSVTQRLVAVVHFLHLQTAPHKVVADGLRRDAFLPVSSLSASGCVVHYMQVPLYMFDYFVLLIR
jgi:hypothetical protein